MKRSLSIVAALTLVIAACGTDTAETDTADTSAPDTTVAAVTTTEPAPVDTTVAEAESVLSVVDSEFGPILADAEGYILYMFVPDNRGDSVCYGDCEAAWPVFYSPATVGDGADGSLTGETNRTDDTVQVTYNGWPLYYFVDDAAPGETNGQGRGDVWYVVNPEGVALVGADEPLSQITLADSEFGPILADGEGNILYMFVPDNQGESVCYGDCEAAWPIFYTPTYTGEGLDAALLASTDRTDDTTQAVYGGWPLYYFVDDLAPGETNGQGRGDVWYVVNAAGEPLVAADEVINQLTVVDSEFGPILADADGNTLYMFVPDDQGQSTCYDDCEANWPVFHVPTWTADGVDGALVDATERTDATKQVTYNGWPLYYFAGDEAVGDTNGQGRGDVWYVLSPEGEVINP